MSVVAITAALEQALAAITPTLATSLPNEVFTPPDPLTTPYQRVNVLFADPDNTEVGPNFIEQGFMQVDLLYPLKTGWGAARARAEIIRAAFRRGSSFTNSGVVTTVTRTPAITNGADEPDRFVQIVRIRFHAHIPG